MSRLPAVGLWALAPLACGEVERADLVVRPRVDDFEREVQPLLERLGCSAGTFCHSKALGGLKIVESPNADELDANYLGVKSMCNLASPDRSPLLNGLLPTEVEASAVHVAVCFPSRDSCAYQKLRAWIDWSSAEDARPQEIDCQVEVPGPAACSAPLTQDACCFRAGN